MKRYIAVFTALAILLIFNPVYAFSDNKTTADSVNAIFVKSHQNADFPSAKNLSAKKLRREIDSIPQYAADGGYNAIFFEVRSEGDALYRSSLFPTSQFLLKEQGAFTFFDPLGEMIKSASKKGLTVYAVVDPYYLGKSSDSLSKKSPAKRDSSLAEQTENGYYLKPFNAQAIRINSEDLGAMAKRYKLGGIILQNTDIGKDEANSAMLLLKSVKSAIKSTKLGIILPDSALEQDYSLAFSYCDIVLPKITSQASPEENSFNERLSAWRQAAGASKVSPFIEAELSSLSATQLTAQAFNADSEGCPARVISSYSFLRENEGFKGDMLASMNFSSSYSPEAVGYSPQQSLSITRPQKSITVNTSSYFIMGTSDPSLSLMLGWKEVERYSSDGVFGVLVNLNNGTNTFTFRQGNSTETVEIIRSSGTGGVITTDKITSAAPKSSLIAYNNTDFGITCVAPSGKTVTATLNGQTITLKQNAVAAANIPATFSGSFRFNSAAESEMKDLGKITYSINGGAETQSNGNVYLLGNGAKAGIEVQDTAASVFPDETVEEGNYKSVYKRGVREEIKGQMGEYYLLASGGYIKKATVKVVDFTDEKPLALAFSEVLENESDERITLPKLGGVAYTFVDSVNNDGACQITLHNVGLSAEASELPTQSELADIAWKPLNDDLICFIRPHNPNTIWGIEVMNDGEDAYIYINRAPKLSKIIGKPLKNLTVVIDPGHGGSDIGAPSALGVSGICEREVNLANAKMLKMRLEQLGAAVTLTREDNETALSLYERMDIAQNVMPDLFISLHHNSVAESVDANIHSGVEAYYYEPFGKALSEAVVKKISQNVYKRDYRFSDWSYYTVTRMRYAPSILCEIGFVPNPLEFEIVCNQTEIYKTANSIAEAILSIIEH